MSHTNVPTVSISIEVWPIERIIPYEHNPRRNDDAVDPMAAAILKFGFKIPLLVRSDLELVDGHLRLKTAKKLGMHELPVILCDEWTEEEVKAFRLLVNRSASWAEWDQDRLVAELMDLKAVDFDLSFTGFSAAEIDSLLFSSPGLDAQAEWVPDPPRNPVSRLLSCA